MEAVLQLLGLPVVQVLLGAIISAWVALRVAQTGVKAQNRQAKLDFLTRIDRDLLDMLSVFEPLPYHVDKAGKTTQGPGQLNNFEKIRALYFKHSTLIDPSLRAALDAAFVRAETAYLMLIAPNETREFKQLLTKAAESRGATAADLLDMQQSQLRAEITGFCGELRSRLMARRDQVVAKIESHIE
jgi:hypothetical protein